MICNTKLMTHILLETIHLPEHCSKWLRHSHFLTRLWFWLPFQFRFLFQKKIIRSLGPSLRTAISIFKMLASNIFWGMKPLRFYLKRSFSNGLAQVGWSEMPVVLGFGAFIFNWLVGAVQCTEVPKFDCCLFFESCWVWLLPIFQELLLTNVVVWICAQQNVSTYLAFLNVKFMKWILASKPQNKFLTRLTNEQKMLNEAKMASTLQELWLCVVIMVLVTLIG